MPSRWPCTVLLSAVGKCAPLGWTSWLLDRATPTFQILCEPCVEDCSADGTERQLSIAGPREPLQMDLESQIRIGPSLSP